MMRRLLERLGLVEPRDPRIAEVRSGALRENEEARRAIHDSRERRAVLQLRLEHIQRRQHRA